MTKKDQTAENNQPDPKKTDPIIPKTNAVDESQPVEDEPANVNTETEVVPDSNQSEETSLPESPEKETVPSEAVAEEPVAEGPAVEEPFVEEVVAEEAIAEEPVAEEPAVEEPVVEETVAEKPAVEEPVVEETVAEKPAVEEPVVEEVVAEGPVAEEPTVEEPVVEEAVAEEAVAEEPVPEEPAAEEPVMEEVVAKEAVVDEPVPEEPAVEEPVVEETVAEKAVTEVPVAEESAPKTSAGHVAEHLVLDINGIHEVADEEEDEESEEEAPPVIEEKFDTFSREKLVDTLEETVRESDVQKIKTRVALIKVAFLKLTKETSQKSFQEYLGSGGDKEAYTPEDDALTVKFNQAFEVYRKNKAKYNEEQELLKLRNLDAKKQILEELKELINSEDNLKKTYDTFKDLQQKWKEIGLVPSAEINNLWQSYHFLVEKFFDKVKISKELRDLDLKKNMEKKMELCEKAEELLLESSIVKSFKQLQKYHEEWKEIGPVPQDKKEEIWERFKTATDKINERRREYYSKVAESQESNLLTKTVLCDKLESLVAEEASTIKDWQEKTNAINELFKMWKSVGPAPRKENDEIWERFRASLNVFFASKKEYFGQIKQDQLNNYNIKLNIVRQAEALKDSSDWKKTTQELINLQKEWKATGPVPRKYSDKIWKKFRAACDEFFERKSSYFSNVDEKEKGNLDKKLDLIKRIEDYEFKQGRTEALEILKGFQREWTEIGHVPIREKDKLHESFRTAINKHLDNLNISNAEMRSIDYRAHVDHLKETPNANWALRKEINALSTKVSKLREEISLWENNIGFLARSKRSELLKQEFERKIEKAKEELAFSETKLRYLQQSMD